MSPGLAPSVFEVAKAHGKLAIPGALTPTELMNAQELGARLVKIFPCGNVGGAKYLKSLKAPFPARALDSDRRSKCNQCRGVYRRRSFRFRRRSRSG